MRCLCFNLGDIYRGVIGKNGVRWEHYCRRFETKGRDHDMCTIIEMDFVLFTRVWWRENLKRRPRLLAQMFLSDRLCLHTHSLSLSLSLSVLVYICSHSLCLCFASRESWVPGINIYIYISFSIYIEREKKKERAWSLLVIVFMCVSVRVRVSHTWAEGELRVVRRLDWTKAHGRLRRTWGS